MANFSFDIVSTYDKAEINNVLAQVQREINNRFDFKNTPAGIEWLGDKTGYTVTGNSEWQVDSILDIVRKNLTNRGQSTKILDLTKPMTENNMQTKKEVPFIDGLDQAKAKQVTAFLKEAMPKVKATIQGDAVRVTSSSKDDLQKAMQALNSKSFDFPLEFNNYR